MAGIAPLSGSTSTPASSGISDAPSNRAIGAAPKPAQADAGSFTAFPSSYAGFGEDGSSYGTVSVVAGRLSVVSSASDKTPAQPAPAQNAPTPGEAPTAGAATQAKQPDTVPVSDSHAPAPAPPPPAPPAVVTAAKKDNADEAPIPADKSVAAQPPGIPDGQPLPPSLGEASSQPQQPLGQSHSDPTQGLLGSSSSQTIPGTPQASSTPSVSPQQGLLGSPPTNPIVIQAEDQQRAAAVEAAAQENAAAAQTQTDHIALQQINARIAAARAAGNLAAVAQLQPKQTAVLGDLQGQTFGGLGSTPPKPFARPEIPTVFLNIAS